MSVTEFTATPYDTGVLLSWNVGSGDGNSTVDDLAEVTIQYSTNGQPNVIPNTPPYAVRELCQSQLTTNVFYHPHLINGVPYRYTLFAHYRDTGEWVGPFTTSAVTPINAGGSPLVSGSASFSKLGVTTILASVKDSKTDITIWLPTSQLSRRATIESVLNAVKPAHTRINVVYEPYYVAQTSTAQFVAGEYSTSTYTVEEGCIKNKVPTIDSSFSGVPGIYGGE